MAAFQNLTRRGAIAALLFVNVIVNVNQFNIASVYSPLALEFHENVSGLGILSSVFFLGVALLEIPGSLFASRFGSKRIVCVSVLFTSISILLSSLSPNFDLIILSRFFAGAGIGATFPALVTLMTANLSKGSRGLGVGLISFTFNVGGIAGLFGWAILASSFGWRPSIFLSGALGILAAVWVYLQVEESSTTGAKPMRLDDLSKILFNRRLIVIILALFGISAASTLDWNFMVYYLEDALNISPGTAGLIGGIGLAFSVVAPFAGRKYDRDRKSRRWIVFAALLTAVGVAVVAFNNLIFALVSVAFVGAGASIGYTVALAVTGELGGKDVGSQSIAVGWADSLSLVGGFVSPILFSFIVLRVGYPLAWISGGLIGFALLIPYLLSRS